MKRSTASRANCSPADISSATRSPLLTSRQRRCWRPCCNPRSCSTRWRWRCRTACSGTATTPRGTRRRNGRLRCIAGTAAARRKSGAQARSRQLPSSGHIARLLAHAGTQMRHEWRSLALLIAMQIAPAAIAAERVAPEMVTIPAGSFLMGSPGSEPGPGSPSSRRPPATSRQVAMRSTGRDLLALRIPGGSQHPRCCGSPSDADGREKQVKLPRNGFSGRALVLWSG